MGKIWRLVGGTGKRTISISAPCCGHLGAAARVVLQSLQLTYLRRSGTAPRQHVDGRREVRRRDMVLEVDMGNDAELRKAKRIGISRNTLAMHPDKLHVISTGQTFDSFRQYWLVQIYIYFTLPYHCSHYDSQYVKCFPGRFSALGLKVFKHHNLHHMHLRSSFRFPGGQVVVSVCGFPQACIVMIIVFYPS